MLAANFLDIKSLLDLCSAKLASWITSKSVEEIREFFGIENDYTPEEEAKIKEENMWAQEAWLWKLYFNHKKFLKVFGLLIKIIYKYDKKFIINY